MEGQNEKAVSKLTKALSCLPLPSSDQVPSTQPTELSTITQKLNVSTTQQNINYATVKQISSEETRLVNNIIAQKLNNSTTISTFFDTTSAQANSQLKDHISSWVQQQPEIIEVQQQPNIYHYNDTRSSSHSSNNNHYNNCNSNNNSNRNVPTYDAPCVVPMHKPKEVTVHIYCKNSIKSGTCYIVVFVSFFRFGSPSFFRVFFISLFVITFLFCLILVIHAILQ